MRFVPFPSFSWAQKRGLCCFPDLIVAHLVPVLFLFGVMGWKQLHARIEERTHMLLFTCQVLACPGNGSACIECFADRFRGAFLCHHQRHGAMHPILVPVVVMCHQVVDIGGAHYCQALVDAPVEGFQVNTEAIDHLDAWSAFFR